MGGTLNWDLDRYSTPRGHVPQEHEDEVSEAMEDSGIWEWTDEMLDAVDVPHEGMRGDADDGP